MAQATSGPRLDKRRLENIGELVDVGHRHVEIASASMAWPTRIERPVSGLSDLQSLRPETEAGLAPFSPGWASAISSTIRQTR